MAEPAAVPLLVVSASRDPVEAVNALLRRQGIAAHCTWVAALNDLPDRLEEIPAQLLLCVTGDRIDVREVADTVARSGTRLPVLAIRAGLDEDALEADLLAGARDTINLERPERAHRVIVRELHAARLQREHEAAQEAVQKSRAQLDSVLTRSNDAILVVQEGILVEANQAWLDLIGATSAAAVTGQPVMDLFHGDSHVALKGALAACLKGQWKDHALKANARSADGEGRIAVELLLTLGEHDGEPCVRVMAPLRKAAGASGAKGEASPATTANTAKAPPSAGAAAASSAPPSKGNDAARAPGPAARSPPAKPAAIPAVPPSAPDASAGGKATPAPAAPAAATSAPASAAPASSASAGTSAAPASSTSAGSPAAAASAPQSGNASAAAASPSPVSTSTSATAAANGATTDVPDLDAKTREHDALWVRHIQAALAENRFRLVQQPITNLGGGPPMFDLLIRMLDRARKEILPGEFLPAAERNNLMGPIDRWVMGAAARFAADSKPGCLFVRLSQQSALDAALTRWLTAQSQSVGLNPSMLCLTVTESVAHAHLDDVRRQAGAIKALGMRFAIERFGAGPDPLALLGTVPMDFVKIDGSLIQGVAGDSLVQSKVEALVEAARERGVETIAANVEDANTMAVLWQLGVQHLEGFLIQAPEEVVLA